MAATIKKYGDTSSLVLNDYGYVWVTSAFGGSALGAVANDACVPSVNANIKDDDDLALLVYADSDWSRLYGFLDYNQYYAAPGEPINALITGMSIMDQKIYIPD